MRGRLVTGCDRMRPRPPLTPPGNLGWRQRPGTNGSLPRARDSSPSHLKYFTPRPLELSTNMGLQPFLARQLLCMYTVNCILLNDLAASA